MAEAEANSLTALAVVHSKIRTSNVKTSQSFGNVHCTETSVHRTQEYYYCTCSHALTQRLNRLPSERPSLWRQHERRSGDLPPGSASG